MLRLIVHPLVRQSPAEEHSGTDPFWHPHFCASAHQFCYAFSSRLFWARRGAPFVLPALAGVLIVVCILLGKEERMCAGSKPDSITRYFRKTFYSLVVLNTLKCHGTGRMERTAYSPEGGRVTVKRRR